MEKGEQVFSQAVRIDLRLMLGTREYVLLTYFSQFSSKNKAVYLEVQERHKDIQKVEETLTELANLFNDVRGCSLVQYCPFLHPRVDEYPGRTAG